MTCEKDSSGSELLESHSLVEFLQRCRVDGLEAKCDLELAAQAVAKLKATIPNQSWMALDDNAIKLGQTIRDRSICSFRDGLLIKETAGVV